MNYEEQYQKQLNHNLSKVLKDLDKKETTLKILNWSKKFGFSFQTIKNKIKEDEIFRCIFIKDPAKQNLYEKTAAKYIKSIKNVDDFKSLPSGGRNAIYLTKGKILKGELLKNKSKDIKSIDFTWKTNDIVFYASHKYTKDNGGAQDNQYKDIQDFLYHARDCNELNVIFLAICDGNYYLSKDSKTGDKTKIERLRRLTDNKTSFVLTINELEKFLLNLNTKINH